MNDESIETIPSPPPEESVGFNPFGDFDTLQGIGFQCQSVAHLWRKHCLSFDSDGATVEELFNWSRRSREVSADLATLARSLMRTSLQIERAVESAEGSFVMRAMSINHGYEGVS